MPEASCAFGDALIPYVGLEYGDFRLGATYDVNVSSLKTLLKAGAELRYHLSILSVHQTEEKGFPVRNSNKFKSNPQLSIEH
jgi:hypothetical protein